MDNDQNTNVDNPLKNIIRWSGGVYFFIILLSFINTIMIYEKIHDQQKQNPIEQYNIIYNYMAGLALLNIIMSISMVFFSFGLEENRAAYILMYGIIWFLLFGFLCQFFILYRVPSPSKNKEEKKKKDENVVDYDNYFRKWVFVMPIISLSVAFFFILPRYDKSIETKYITVLKKYQIIVTVLEKIKELLNTYKKEVNKIKK
jgi:peptidoglycan/LPS O-acetylase OafA/YrhL